MKIKKAIDDFSMAMMNQGNGFTKLTLDKNTWNKLISEIEWMSPPDGNSPLTAYCPHGKVVIEKDRSDEFEIRTYPHNPNKEEQIKKLLNDCVEDDRFKRVMKTAIAQCAISGNAMIKTEFVDGEIVVSLETE